MSICWYCYWGWAKPVAEIYLQALEKLNGDSSPLNFSFAHVVWEDENFELAESCLEDYKKNPAEYLDRYTQDDLNIVEFSLIELIKIPLNQRCIQPENYDDENPEKYPPLCEVIKI